MLLIVMAIIIITSSISMMRNRMVRKPKNLLSERTKRRHISEEQRRVKNMILKNMKTAVATITRPKENISTIDKVRHDCESVYQENATACFSQVDHEILYESRNENIDEFQFSEESSDSGESISSINSDCEDEIVEKNSFHEFKSQLITTFLSTNINHSQGDKLLATLRTHPCFTMLPKSTKTLLNTPRKSLETIKMGSGEYLHIGLKNEIIKKLLMFSTSSEINHIIIDIHTDGMSVHRSGNTQIWPIQFRIHNIPEDKPAIIGVYVGQKKPDNSIQFFEYFIKEFHDICRSGGIIFQKRTIPIYVRTLIADAPARALMLNHRGHNSVSPCSKCKVVGKSYNRTMCFSTVINERRTDLEYINTIDKKHHLLGKSALEYFGVSMLTSVPFEYMHLICLGVVKKFLSAIVDKKYASTGFDKTSIKEVSSRLNIIQSYCPYEFSRRPRLLEDYQHYKATEFRQLLLYTGPVIFKDFLKEEEYLHFLLLHSACRVLLTSSPDKISLEYAEIALKVYVECCPEIFGVTYMSYNVHGLLHVVEDVRKFGNLNSFSAFPYEDNMTFFRKYLRKPTLLLQQLYNRMQEGAIPTQHLLNDKKMKPLHSHKSGPIPESLKNLQFLQYKGLHFDYVRFMAKNNRDDCILLKSGEICIIHNIIRTISDNRYILVVKKFMEIKNYYKVPYGIDSYLAGVYECNKISSNFEAVYLTELFAKCYKMPSWKHKQLEDDKFIVMTLLSNY